MRHRARTLLLLLLLTCPLPAQPPFHVRLRTPHGDTTVEMPLERYVAAVVAGESSVFQSGEALKAMAVAARTYAVRLRGRHSAEGYDFCATTHCQRLDPDAVTPRLESVADQTAGELLWFEGKPAFTCYTLACGGRTEDASAVWPDMAAPYLQSHDDPHCAAAGAFPWQWTANPGQLTDALHLAQLRAPRHIEHVTIAAQTPSGRARTLTLSGQGESIRISAGSFRFAVGRALGWNTVRSDRYQIRSSNGAIVFEGAGAGHGVGLCQRGADQMGQSGLSYHEILAFYYPGTVSGLTGRGLSWQRLGGDTLALFSTQPARDRDLLPLAERLARAASQRTNLNMPRNLEIRVYPDLDTFRNATGEPGWVAAHTEGLRIHLQPAAVLRSRGILETTLRHELLHALLESQAAPGLPIWFREGLAGYFDHPLAADGPSRAPSDAGLRQTSDPERARRAYQDAVRKVSSLVARYGEATVLGWLRTGLPAEVKSANNSQAPTKSR